LANKYHFKGNNK